MGARPHPAERRRRADPVHAVGRVRTAARSRRAPVATIVFKNRRALFSWVWDPALNFGEAYMFGAVEIRGDLVALLEAIYRALRPASRGPGGCGSGRTTCRPRATTSISHYDLGNDFYRLWLDREMVYTCAYFPTPDVTLEEAQIAKMDHVCRKLRLRPGERVIEAGCGWGALALLHGARVWRHVARLQHLARADCATRASGRAREGLDRPRRVHRGRLPQHRAAQCDAFVSVGMLEHVGLADFPRSAR